VTVKSKKDLKVLVVDDDPELLYFTKMMFGQTSLVVTTATNGQECLDSIRRSKPDLLLLDVMLPDISGIEVCSTIKNDPGLASIYVLLISGLHINTDHISTGFETGADGYLTKPLVKREFLARIDAICRVILAETALKESEERYRHISSTISDISYSCVSDPNSGYSINWLTGATERILGYSIDEIVAIHCWSALVIDEDLPLFKKYVTGLKPDKTANCELRLRTKNGRIVWIASFAECVHNQNTSDGTILYGALVDINERKKNGT
jgi:PAS domain S-box-containing protein